MLRAIKRLGFGENWAFLREGEGLWQRQAF